MNDTRRHQYPVCEQCFGPGDERESQWRDPIRVPERQRDSRPQPNYPRRRESLYRQQAAWDSLLSVCDAEAAAKAALFSFSPTSPPQPAKAGSVGDVRSEELVTFSGPLRLENR